MGRLFRRTTTTGGTTLRRRLAWLIVIALLVDGLLPAAVALGSGPLPAATGFCAAAAPAKGPGKAAPVPHCPLCFVATVIGLLPPRAPVTPRPRVAVVLPRPILPGVASPLELRRPAAQPRAPPAAA